MKILIIHPTFSPVIGTSETCMCNVAEGLSKLGHSVSVLTGVGAPASDLYSLTISEFFDPSYPLNVQVKKAVDHGQTDHYLQEFTHQIKEFVLGEAAGHDVIMTHGAFTTHFNLAFTQAMWEVAEKHPTVEWSHDFTPTNTDYALPCPDKLPWSLMRQAHPKVAYIASSEFRKGELVRTLKLDPERVSVIPVPIHPSHTFGLHADLTLWIEGKEILQRDLVLYYPSRVLPRKGMEQAVDMAKAIKEAGISVALLLTKAGDVNTPPPSPYDGFISSLAKMKKLEDEVFFMNHFAEWNDEMWGQLFQISDVLLFPSRHESFGLSVVQATLHRLPVWHRGLESLQELQVPATVVDSPQGAVKAAQELTVSEAFAARKRWLREGNYLKVCDEKILPLLHSVSS